MSRLIVGNISNTKKPTKKQTSALAEIRRKRRYFVFFNGFFSSNYNFLSCLGNGRLTSTVKLHA